MRQGPGIRVMTNMDCVNGLNVLSKAFKASDHMTLDLTVKFGMKYDPSANLPFANIYRHH